jgi:hypothetical protein
MNYNNILLEQRIKETTQLLKKYPHKIPVYIDIPKNDIILEKRKYLVDNNISLMNLQVLLKKSINISSTEGVYMLINKQLMTGSTEIGTIYKNNKNEDGMLYIQLLKENTFGFI